jgi:hypothetical protein
MDVSMMVQSATKVGSDLWNGLKGTPSVNPNPLPFMDQGISDSKGQPQTGGGRDGHRRTKRRHRKPKRRSNKASRRSRRSRRTSSSGRRFRQSGGDIFSYLPFDMSTTARSAANVVANTISSTKGLQGSVSPLPYNDHALQKPELKASDHLPNLPQYYKNANLSIPSL